MVKRVPSGYSRLIGINKPIGMSSHDVVNRVRRIFNERRVGHAGTLDPLASGVLLVCVGPATRLDQFLVGHGKRYRMGVAFGASTTTDDSEGEVIKTLSYDISLEDPDFARQTISGLIGPGMQLPPVYSAIKVDGKKSYEQARKGNIIDLAPRPFEIYDAQLIDVRMADRVDGVKAVEWVCEMSVSKGTYMRSIARDLGRSLSTCAYVSSLERVRSGCIELDDCVGLDELEAHCDCGIIDPLRALGIRFAFVRDAVEKVNNGSWLSIDEVSLNEPLMDDRLSPCTCTTGIIPSHNPPFDGEAIGVIVNNRLKAIYEFDESKHRYVARCVFPIGVERGRTV